MTPASIRKLVILCYFGLVLTIVLWYFVFSPPQFVFSTVLSLLYITILLLPLPALLKRKPGTCLWSSYLILLYVMHAIVETYANAAYRVFAIGELVFSLGYFFSASLCVRHERRGKL
jgi:uncharacterized membrane protein